MKRILSLILIASTFMVSCSENYSNGERVGTITQFSHKGNFFKSWEGHLNTTQTGNNQANGFDFSIDNDNEDTAVVAKLDSAAREGWKVRLTYHQVWGFKNFLNNRGHEDFFVNGIDVIDRDFSENATTRRTGSSLDTSNGHHVTVNTVYVVIIDSSRIKR